MGKSKKYKKKLHLNTDMQIWFCIISLLGIAGTVLSLFLSQGKIFSQIFWGDSNDTGMDFFHSIEYTRGRSPYDLFGTLYPPLANLFFYILYRLVPLEQSSKWADTFMDSVMGRGTSKDLRVWQPTMMLFICFILLSAIALVFMVQAILGHSATAGVVSLCIILSYGVLYAFERGNIIIISVLCCMFFIKYKDSNNKFISELALIMLAIGAGLKMYPALFGVLLIYDKQYTRAIRTILYGLIFFIVPVFVFHEGIGGIGKFINILFSFVDKTQILSSGYSFDKILNTIVLLFTFFFDYESNEFIVSMFMPMMNVAVMIIILFRGFYVKKQWQKILGCSLAILLYQTQGIYGLTFLAIPFLFMIKEEKEINKANVIPYIALVFTQVLLPIWDTNSSIISWVYLRFQICVVVLAGGLFVQRRK